MPKVKLEDLLPEQLETLTPAEKTVLDKVQQGVVADCSLGETDALDLQRVSNWSPERSLRAGFLIWLATDAEALACIHPKGIQILGARVTGKLDLGGCTLVRSFGFVACALEEGIVLTDAQVVIFGLRHAVTGPVHAGRLHARGSVFLQQTRVMGEVNMMGAKIGGNLDCCGAWLENPVDESRDRFDDGDALSADGMIVEGSVLLRGSRVDGAVRLLDAAVGGELDCVGARLSNVKTGALIADGLSVGRSLLLREAQIEGNVRLVNAKVGASLECDNLQLRFRQQGTPALHADGLRVEGGVFLRNGFQVRGEVRLIGANIGADLDCYGAMFDFPGAVALNLEKTRVGGALDLSHFPARPAGRFNLRDVSARRLIDDEQSWPGQGELWLEGFTYDALTGSATAERRLDWLNLQYPAAMPGRGKKVAANGRSEILFRPQPYTQLAQYFRSIGHDGEARTVLIAKQDALRQHGQLNLKDRLWNGFLGKTIGHGYEPWKVIVRFIMPIILLGWAVFLGAEHFGLMREMKTPAPDFYPFVYSVDVFFPFVKLHQEEFWMPDSDARFGIVVWLYMWIHIALGWVLSTLAVAALTGLVRKE